MGAPVVSIVMPSYQQARFLRAALDSVLEQDYRPLEVLVVDGGSTDGTLPILESYGDRIWFRSQPDGGQCDAINAGFRRSKGGIVAWLNSDDVYYPGAVRRAVDALTAAPAAGLVYGEGDLIDAEGELIRRFPETVPFDLWRLTHVADYILQPTVFVRRDVLFACGLLDQQLNWGLDWDLWIRLGKRMPFVYVSEVLAASRIHDATKTSTGGFRRLRELLDILRGHGVVGLSPAGVAHTVTTVARRLSLSPDQITADRLSAGLPSRLGAIVRPSLARLERRLRRWLENAQGIWRDGLVGSVGHLWLPSDGHAAALRIRGRNLQLRDQVVALRCGRKVVRTPVLAPGERFTLELRLPPEQVPVKAMLTCACTTRVAPAGAPAGAPAEPAPISGARRAGFVLEDRELVA